MMPYQKLLMYLATIPDFDSEDNDGESSKTPKVTGSFNLFDYDQR
jgi:hypothetical protein